MGAHELNPLLSFASAQYTYRSRRLLYYIVSFISLSVDSVARGLPTQQSVSKYLQQFSIISVVQCVSRSVNKKVKT